MLGRKTLLSLISLIFVRLCQGILLLIAVNKFLPFQFGYWNVAQSLLAFFLFFSDLNLSIVHLKIMAEKEEKNVPFTIYFTLKIILVLISSFIFIIIIILSLKFNFVTNNQEQFSIFIIYFIDRLIFSFLMVYNSSFQATLKVAKKEMATIIGQIFGLIFGFISIIVLKSFILYLTSTIISNGISLLLCIYYGTDFKITKINKNLLIKYLKLDVIFILPFFIDVLITNLGPLIFLQYYDEELLGIFYVITSFYLVIKGLEMVLRSLFIPNFTIALKKNKIKNIRKTINLYEKYTAILNALIITIGIIFGDYIMKTLFGYIYFEKGILLYIGYNISLLSFVILSPYSPLIIASEKFKIYTFNLLISLIFSILSWLLFIPSLNILGITLGIWISIIPQAIFIRYYCFKYFKVGKMKRKSAFHLIVIILMILTSLYFYSLNLSFLLRIFIFLSILFLYFTFLIFSKILQKKDFDYIINLINPNKMLDYIKEETRGNGKS